MAPTVSPEATTCSNTADVSSGGRLEDELSCVSRSVRTNGRRCQHQRKTPPRTPWLPNARSFARMAAMATLPAPVPRRLIHTRDVRTRGFLRDDGLWDLEGELR